MVRIIKTMQPKHLETLSPWLKAFVTSACSTSLPLLPQHLASFPTRWPFPRGDLYHWISLLNRFDVILENFCKTYKLDDGPQTTEFGCKMLESTEGSSAATTNGHNLADLGFGEAGDRQLVDSILGFSKMLLQNCGNRSLYASSSHLSNLLNTTSLSLLESTLLLGIELAQRYHAAIKRLPLGAKHHPSILQNHYNIDLEKVTQLAQPFSKKLTLQYTQGDPATPSTPAPLSAKGKEKAFFNLPASLQSSTTTVYATDLVSMVKGGSGAASSTKTLSNGIGASTDTASMDWNEWGDVKVTYYSKPMEAESTTPRIPAVPTTPTTPTPVRRSSNLGPHGQRSSRASISEDSPSFPRSPALPAEGTQLPSFKSVEISSSKLKSDGMHTLLQENIVGLPQESQYELLTKLRVADALTSSIETRRQILVIRLLAITNMAYINAEPYFLENVLKQDSEEPRRLQLTSQLAELIHPPAEGDVAVPQPLQTVAFLALDALSQQPSKYTDVCAALNTNVNHGVLLYVIRKAVAGMSSQDAGDKVTEEDEWRDALFCLINDISGMPRTGADLVTAGLIPILVEILGLRTPIAERYQPKVLTFLDNIMNSARDAFQTLVSADGLDAVSNLIVFEVTAAAENAAGGRGMQPEHRPATVDYEIPYFQQQTLKWLFKFIHHMMTTAGGYGGNFDRLLRNLIDSSQLLGSLRQIISNARVFGSVVWTNAVNILNDFINNEPTSFAVIAEAGLSRGLLEAVTGRVIIVPSEAKKVEPEGEPSENASSPAPSPPSDDEGSDNEYGQPLPRPTLSELQTPREGPLACGIMPTSETISIVPQAFGAICLNNAGMKMFQASGALESFFEVFESPAHIKCMESNKDLPSHLGGTFDELVRHHPPLKPAIINAVLNMVTRVSSLCKSKAEQQKLGAKLWTYDASGEVIIADEDMMLTALEAAPKGKGKATDNNNDVEMMDADFFVENGSSQRSPPVTTTESMTPYVTAVATFLVAIFNNSSVRSDFSSNGGIEHILDLADSPCLTYDYATVSASRPLYTVISHLADTKAHLTMPSLLRRAQSAADVLAPFTQQGGNIAFFRPFVNREAQESADPEFLAQGSQFAKALVNVLSLVSTLQTCFLNSSYNHRSTNNGFNQLNLGDYYVEFVKSLAPLLGAALREIPALEKSIPNYYKNSHRGKDSIFSTTPPDLSDPEPVTPPDSAESDGPVPVQLHVDASVPNIPPPAPEAKLKSLTKADRDSPEFKNYQTLRHLLDRMSKIISPFFQTLGKSLVSKRGGVDGFQKQSHAAIADALASTVLSELRREEDYSLETSGLWMGMINVFRDILVDHVRHTERSLQTITLVLQAFKEHGGFDTLNKALERFADVIQSSPSNRPMESLHVELCVMGMQHILELYSQIVSGKNVTDSVQTMAMTSREGRDGRPDRTRPDYFSPPQFLVELRMAVLPTVRKLWESEVVEKGPSNVSEKLIDVIRTIANADSESNAHKRSDKPVPATKSPRKTFKINSENLTNLVDHDYDAELAREALYRCSNSITLALDYCREAQRQNRLRYPIPEGDVTPEVEAPASSRPRTSNSTGTATPDGPVATSNNPLANVPAILDSLSQQMPAPAVPGNEPVAPQNFDLLLDQFVNRTASAASASVPATSSSSAVQETSPNDAPQGKQVTVDDLNDERAAIRDNLIDKCLDVINAHGEVTFEVSDLISAVISKSPDPTAQRRVVGETLVVALMSFAGDEDMNKSGKKIAAYAHLLALMLRDKNFYAAAVGELKENLSTLLSFIHLSPNHSADESSPWIAQILLIVEMLLSEDKRPQKLNWVAPHDDNDPVQTPVLAKFEPAVSADEQARLMEAVLGILPRIGKDESLALSVLRILVILTRSRPVAQNMGEKKNIQRLFLMAKQLAGAPNSTKIHGPLMLILRHIVEDDETIKQIMRSEIKAHFDLNKVQRSNNDPVTYLRGLAHVSLRAPQLFVEVTNEMVKYSRWAHSSPDASSRANSLALKGSATPETSKQSDDTVLPTLQGTEDLTLQEVKTSTENMDVEMQDAPKVLPADHKLPIVENPDGVIHFILCELLKYKDVEDQESPSAPVGPTSIENPTTTINGDSPMAGTSPTRTPDVALPNESKSPKPGKQEFKPEEHPIYIYRCLLLQCLTELLGSYNRTKIEFINFKRSAPPLAMTPSKPRSSVVNYLLSDLIPLGTLESTMTIPLQKKIATSSWADSVITALLTKTGEQLVDRERDEYDGDDEPDLLFVRKFVLENILKAYKEAAASNDSLDVKYARMYSLADLMEHIMSDKSKSAAQDGSSSSIALRSHAPLRRLMFEKGFITALTASIADVDLNFPGAKRAVKQILKPLKVLTNTAVRLSYLKLISATPGQNEEEEIESATSVSDVQEREETPDLFRNSTLGMFEPGRDEESSSGSSSDDDEAMYDDGYGDVEYEEDPGDDEDNVSEDDEDGIGPIEGLSGDHALEVEVLLNEDEDEDDDDDDEEDSSDDDGDSEDDDARVEIIDEAGNIQELGADDGMDDWEDEDGDHDDGEEEEDYEGRAQDHDEAEIHDMEAMMGSGPLGELVRALGGGNQQALEMADRIDEEMQDEDLDHPEIEDGAEDRVAVDYDEEDDEDEDEEDDMDEEEMFLGGAYYPDGSAGVPFGLEGDVESPVVIHRGHHHRPRHAFPGPFPLFPGRDPLGGMSNPSHQSLGIAQTALERAIRESELATERINAAQAELRLLFEQPSHDPPPPVAEMSPFLSHRAIIRSRLDAAHHSAVRQPIVPNSHPSLFSTEPYIANHDAAPGEFRYRSHTRPGQAPTRSTDDGTNPLLQRNGSGRASRDGSNRAPANMGNWIHAMAPPDLMELARGAPFGESPATAALFELIRSLPDLPGTIGRNGAALQFHFTTTPGQEVPSDFRAMFGIRGSRYEPRRESTEPGSAVYFAPQSTSLRWSEAAKLLFGLDYTNISTNLRNAIDSVLVPPYIEADKVRKAAEAERVLKLEEEAKKRAEEERVAKEAKEAAENIEREKKEAEEAETAARLAAEALAARGGEPEPIEEEATEPVQDNSEAMEGVEGGGEPSENEPAENTPAEDRPRVTTVIRGNTMDITDLGIDADFLAELPEEIREEVIMSAVSERRSQAAATGGQPSDIDQEFLDALPEDIREEIIQQERAERRRREREDARRQASAANGGAPAAPDMDAASILATLPPALRQQVLMEQDEDMLNLLPQELADQARAAQRDHPAHHGRPPVGLVRRNGPVVGDVINPPGLQRAPRRLVVQMLDKSGIATLLRLMFTYQVNNFRSALNAVLENVSLNRQNRTEVLGTLLSILQDGSMDMPAVERSFNQLSIRAKTPKERDNKTPLPLKRTFTGMSSSVSLTQSISEAATPLLVVQQCLSALNNLTSRNPHVPAYFLTEHDLPAGLKRSLSRKGKGKENKDSKYAINSLLTLLDRDLIMESSSVMELLSTLLSLITEPLQTLQRKQKEAEEAAKKVEAPTPVVDANASVTSPEIASADVQPTDQPAETSPRPDATATSTDAPVAEPPATVGETSETSKSETKVPEKRPRQITPPVIPEQNLKLVINIFIARECSSRTFRETLTTIKNLSAIPGAKAIFGRELITKAQGLGEIILMDLQDLLPQIQKATTGTEIQGIALAKFSPSSSDQNKLLRVLTALDHLFDPKREKKDQPTEAETEGESSQLVEKQDLLSSLYENSTFGPMWEKLSACLSAIRQREHMLNVATILLPLIESLMVVCKNTTLKEAPLARSGKDSMLTSPPPESRMESLFFTFTEEHRKILNDLVRHNPKLMSRAFSLLVKNPKVLEFDNKRNYFSRSIHTKASNSRQSFPPLQLSVRRDQVFHDSFKSLYFQTGDQMKYGKLSIRFHGEEGVDAGGVTREWFQVLSRQMFDPGYALFIPVSSDRTTFHPNQLSSVNEEHLYFFKFIGRVIGKALYEGRVLDCHFSRAVYKRILGKAVSVKDMESLDPEYYKNLVWMLDNDITDIITETFSVDNDKFGVVETIDFIPNGRNVSVTEENKHEYVRLMVEWRLTGSIKEQLDEFLKGFHEIIPEKLVAIFNEQELELLISGLPEIDVDDWKGNTEYHNYTASSPQIQWFWRAVRSYDKEERAKLLQFVTGTSKVPLNGFKELEGMNGFSRFNIHRDYGNKERLPSSHTCFNQLDLPEYESYEALRTQILTAITAGSEYFGFA